MGKEEPTLLHASKAQKAQYSQLMGQALGGHSSEPDLGAAVKELQAACTLWTELDRLPEVAATHITQALLYNAAGRASERDAVAAQYFQVKDLLRQRALAPVYGNNDGRQNDPLRLLKSELSRLRDPK
eukprot:NODE_2214_length_496_cov_584.957494_g1809_i0.p1 GENE.NODE_2214_length_496_cov_584.957494_g1809_i0~~NODE_2214_length_496_cov_584.957494_g1809_i0.p1  ORF type:complete len:136 (+),score=36.82 NODE_2214_length_496_cov_584.957494_g1809_i0:27-410(+)